MKPSHSSLTAGGAAKRAGNAWRWLLAATAVLILVAIATHAFWLAALARYLVDADPPAPADVVIVLAGDLEGNRIVTGADLVRRGLAPKVLVSGPDGLFGEHESDFAIAYAVRRGYPESYFIPVPNSARSTVAEAQVLIPLARKLGAHRIDLVTSNFHTRRARQVYHEQAPDLEIHIVAAVDRQDPFRPESWWRNRENRKIFLIEWMKTIANWLGM